MATRVDYVNSIKNADMDTIYLTGAGYVNYPFKGISRESALGWNEPVWGSDLNRGLNLVMDNIDTVEYGMVARCEVSFKYMNIKDYKVLCKISKQRVCYANFFDRETGQRVSQEMAFTGNEIAKLYKFNTDYLGVLDASIKLVATNRDRVNEISATHTISYNANGGTGLITSNSVKWAGQLQLPSSGVTKSGSTLLGWNTQANGYGADYKLGQQVTIFGNLGLYAQWSDSANLKSGKNLNILIKQSTYASDVDEEIENIVIDNYTGEDEYISFGVNQIAGLTSIGYADSNNKVKVYKTEDNKNVFILAPKNCTIYANNDCTALFWRLKKLESIKLNNFNTSNTTNMEEMFYETTNLKSLNLLSFDTSNVVNMSYMFAQSGIKELKQNFNTSNVVYMSGMFTDCPYLKRLDLSNFNTSNVLNIEGMFRGCSSLYELNISSFDTSQVASLNFLFSECSLLKHIDVSSFNTSNVTTMGYIFSGCSSLTEIDVSNFDTQNVTSNVAYDKKGVDGMFERCASLKIIDISTFNTSKLKALDFTFMDCTSLETLILPDLDSGTIMSLQQTFKNCSSLTEINIPSIDTTNLYSMSGLFYGCSSLTVLDLSLFELSINSIGIDETFAKCKNLRTIYVSPTKWNPSKLRSSSDTFSECLSIVGGNGTTYDSTKTSNTYARIDTPQTPGYLTEKP